MATGIVWQLSDFCILMSFLFCSMQAAGGNTPRTGATPTSSPAFPRRPAPTAKPRARAPMPPTAKREVAAPAGDEPEAKQNTSVVSNPAKALAATLKAGAKESPKPSPKVARKPPPARSLPQPPKKVLPVPPAKKEARPEDDAGEQDETEEGENAPETISPAGTSSSFSFTLSQVVWQWHQSPRSSNMVILYRYIVHLHN